MTGLTTKYPGVMSSGRGILSISSYFLHNQLGD